MAQAKRRTGFFSQVMDGLLGRVHEALVDVSKTVQSKVQETMRRLVRELFQLCFLIVATIFVLIGAVYVVNEYFIMSKGMSFITVGFGLMVILLLYRSMGNR